MNRIFTAIIASTAWFAVIVQLVLTFQNQTQSTVETLLRFFTFFTILTNLLVAITFSRMLLKEGSVSGNVLTMVTVYIVVVGLVYQVALRSVWNPQGMQKVVDELLHSVVPVLVLVYWITQLKYLAVSWKVLSVGVIYPLVYLLVVLLRGAFTGYYPYPFLDAGIFGWTAVLLNILVLVFVFIGFLAAAVFIGKRFGKKSQENPLK